MTKKAFKNILLIGRQGVPGVPETLDMLKDFLLSLKVNITVEEQTATCMESDTPDICTPQAIPKKTDLIIVVGGDGSLLNAAHIAIEHNIPIIGVHRGRLGFLTDINPNSLEQIGEVIHGSYKEEKRFLLRTTIHQQKRTVSDYALNDVVLMPGDAPQMIEFEIHINNEFVCSQRADGLIIATPTGSTAYALSAGGPILKPGLSAVTIVPMCPHTLSSRPIVVNGDSCIELIITQNNKNTVNVTCDGIQHIPVNAGDRITIEQHEKCLTLIHPSNYNYFTTLREKLNWEQRAERA
jgi:NAD+ kinase